MTKNYVREQFWYNSDWEVVCHLDCETLEEINSQFIVVQIRNKENDLQTGHYDAGINDKYKEWNYPHPNNKPPIPKELLDIIEIWVNNQCGMLLQEFIQVSLK